jgi:hypothetical protein
MIKFNAPAILSGSQLKKELNAAGVKIDLGADSIEINGNGDLLLAIAKKDEAKAQEVIDAHSPVFAPTGTTLEQKLETIGLTIEELKTALLA